MTNNNHPITPPPELVKKWMSFNNIDIAPLYLAQMLATQAARWGADQELETGPYGFSIEATAPSLTKRLRAARRPEPPSLKEQALAELELLRGDANAHGLGFDAPAIRRALETLPD